MLKVMKTPLKVAFYNRAMERLSGRLLVYEITGDACIQMERKKVWVPFSRLTRESRKQVMKSLKADGRLTAILPNDMKIRLIVTLVVIWAYARFVM